MIVDYHLEREDAKFFCDDNSFFLYRIDGEFLYCDAFYVKPEHRGSDKSREIFELMLDMGKSKGCKTFVAWVDLNSNNPIAVHKALTGYGIQVYDATTNPEYHEYRMDL